MTGMWGKDSSSDIEVRRGEVARGKQMRGDVRRREETSREEGGGWRRKRKRRRIEWRRKEGREDCF